MDATQLDQSVTKAWNIAKPYKEELAGITKAKLTKAFLEGQVFTTENAFLMYTPSKKYLGVSLGLGGVVLNYVATSAQGSGEAVQLLSMLKDDYNTIALMVREDNPRAISFYKKHGFTQERLVPYKSYNSLIMVWRR